MTKEDEAMTNDSARMTNDKTQSSNQVQSSNKPKPYDLEERTALFGEQVVRFANSLEKTIVSRELVSQLVRSSTSIGANYMEADAAESHRDFSHKIAISKKEAKETMHWLRMIAAACPSVAVKCRLHWKEARELTRIFSAIIAKGRKKHGE